MLPQGKCAISRPNKAKRRALAQLQPPARVQSPVMRANENGLEAVHAMLIARHGAKAGNRERTLRDSIQWKRGQGILVAFNQSLRPAALIQDQHLPSIVEPEVKAAEGPRRQPVVTFDLGNTRLGKGYRGKYHVDLGRKRDEDIDFKGAEENLLLGDDTRKEEVRNAQAEIHLAWQEIRELLQDEDGVVDEQAEGETKDFRTGTENDPQSVLGVAQGEPLPMEAQLNQER